MYAHIENGTVAEYPIADIRAHFPEVSLPAVLTDDNLPEGFVQVRMVSMPAANAGCKVAADGIELVDGTWQQKWLQVPLSQEEQAALRALQVPQVVSKFQAKAALDEMGLLEQVKAVMANPDTPTRTVLAWEDAQEFRRQSPTVNQIGQVLGLTEIQLDDLFILAGSIEA